MVGNIRSSLSCVAVYTLFTVFSCYDIHADYRVLCVKYTAYRGSCVTLSRTEKPAKASTCARDRRALQQLALNVHAKHSDPIIRYNKRLP